jgi:hypothetical protein
MMRGMMIMTADKEKRICPFTLNNSKWMGGHGCLEEKCMAWQPPHEEKHPPGNGNDYIKDWPGCCRLIE